MTSARWTNEKCGEVLATGQGCAFPAGRCPVHEESRPTDPEPAGPDEGAQTTPARTPRAQTTDIRNLAHEALKAVSELNASPTLATRFVNAIKATQSLGEPEWTFDEKFAEAALLGSIMHGIPPRDREDWEELEKTHDPYTLQLLYRWYPWTWGEDIALDKVEDGAGLMDHQKAWTQLMQERKEWGERHPGWEDIDDLLSDPPPWRTRIRSRYGPNPPKASIGYKHPPFRPEEADEDDDW